LFGAETASGPEEEFLDGPTDYAYVINIFDIWCKY